MLTLSEHLFSKWILPRSIDNTVTSFVGYKVGQNRAVFVFVFVFLRFYLFESKRACPGGGGKRERARHEQTPY